MPSSPRPHHRSIGSCWIGSCQIGLWALGLGCAATPPPSSPDATQAGSGAPEAASPSPASPPPEAPAPEATPSGAGDASEPAPSAPAAGSAPDSRTRNDIQAVMAANRDKVRACYDAALAQNPGIQGNLVINFVIDPRGGVKTAEVSWADSDIHVPELDTCAVDAVRAIQFPPSSRGLESKVTYPFNFKPQRPNPPSKAPPQPH